MDSFILFTKHRSIIDKLPAEERGALFSAIMLYCDTGEKTELPLAASIVFDVMIDVIDTNYQKWQEKAQERTEKARNAAEVRWNNPQTTTADDKSAQACSSITENAQACSSMLKHDEKCSSIFSDARDALSVSVSGSVSVLNNTIPLPPLEGNSSSPQEVLLWEESSNEVETIDRPPKQSAGSLDAEKRARKKEYLSRIGELFAEFWDSYPRKESRAAAEKAFFKLAPPDDLAAKMIASVKLQTDTIWQGKEKQYIPHATTWINQKRWEDEISSGSSSPRRKSLKSIDSFSNNELEEQMLVRSRDAFGGDDI